MSFFDDDPFDEIFKEFFGSTRQRTSSGSRGRIKSEGEERIIDYIEEDDKIYFVFEISGYAEEDIDVSVKGKDLQISALKENPEGAQPYLYNKLQKGIYFRKTIPEKINAKKMTKNFKNGILEVCFLKK